MPYVIKTCFSDENAIIKEGPSLEIADSDFSRFYDDFMSHINQQLQKVSLETGNTVYIDHGELCSLLAEYRHHLKKI
jgi:hypothetical protein